MKLRRTWDNGDDALPSTLPVLTALVLEEFLGLWKKEDVSYDSLKWVSRLRFTPFLTKADKAACTKFIELANQRSLELVNAGVVENGNRSINDVSRFAVMLELSRALSIALGKSGNEYLGYDYYDYSTFIKESPDDSEVLTDLNSAKIEEDNVCAVIYNMSRSLEALHSIGFVLDKIDGGSYYIDKDARVHLLCSNVKLIPDHKEKLENENLKQLNNLLETKFEKQMQEFHKSCPAKIPTSANLIRYFKDRTTNAPAVQ